MFGLLMLGLLLLYVSKHKATKTLPRRGIFFNESYVRLDSLNKMPRIRNNVLKMSVTGEMNKRLSSKYALISLIDCISKYSLIMFFSVNSIYLKFAS